MRTYGAALANLITLPHARRRGASLGSSLAGLAILLMAVPTVQAQYFRDDFEDGSATDGSPVTWVHEVPPWPVGEQRVEAGSLILTPARDEFPNSGFYETDWEVERDFPTDLVLRTQIRALGSSGLAYQGVYARDTTSIDAGLGVYTSAIVGSNGYLELSVGKDLNPTTLSQATFADLTTRTHDINLELRLLGQQVEVFAWRDGTSRPLTPKLTGFSPLQNVTMGRVGVFFGQEDDIPTISGAFRYFEAAPVPELSTLMLAGIAALPLLRRARQRRPVRQLAHEFAIRASRD